MAEYKTSCPKCKTDTELSRGYLREDGFELDLFGDWLFGMCPECLDEFAMSIDAFNKSTKV